jgi:hypothetical protein
MANILFMVPTEATKKLSHEPRFFRFLLDPEILKSPLPLFSKEGLKSYGENSPFEKGGSRGI